MRDQLLAPVVSPETDYDAPSRAPSSPRPTSAYLGRVKYNLRRSRNYQRQDPSKNRAEMALIEKAFASIPKRQHILDIPCGGGRATLKLARDGYRVTAADLSASMRQIASSNLAQAGLPDPVLALDVEAIQLPDRSVDTALCFRLFHHFPNVEIRRQAVSELCRVSRHYVVLSYLSVWAYTSILRRLQSLLLKKRSGKFSNTLRDVKGYFDQAGFHLVQDHARFPFVHTLHLAVFKRTGATQ